MIIEVSTLEKALRDTPDFPNKALNAPMRHFAARKDGLKLFGAFLEQWQSDIEASVKSQMRLLNLILLILIAGCIGIMVTSFFSIMNALPS